MVDYEVINRALERTRQEVRREIMTEGAGAERAAIAAEIRKALGLDDSRHARHNLDGALINIEHANNVADVVCRQTMRRVIEQLAEVERIIERSHHAQPEPATPEGNKP